MNFGTRYYVEISTADNTVISNFSQIDKPSIYELRAFVMATLDLQNIRLQWVTKNVGPGLDGFECSAICYGIWVNGEQIDAYITMNVRPNDMEFTHQFGLRAPESTDEETEAYYERWHQLAPRRVIDG